MEESFESPHLIPGENISYDGYPFLERLHTKILKREGNRVLIAVSNVPVFVAEHGAIARDGGLWLHVSHLLKSTDSSAKLPSERESS